MRVVAGIVEIPVIAVGHPIFRRTPCWFAVCDVCNAVIMESDQCCDSMVVVIFTAERRSHQTDHHGDHHRDQDQYSW